MTYQSKISLIGVVGTMLMASSQASAAPSAEAHCTKVLKIPAGNPGAMWDDACDVAYLMPPDFGTAQVTAASTTTNINLCPGVLSLTAAQNTLLESYQIIATELQTEIANNATVQAGLAVVQNQLAVAQAAEAAANTTVLNDQATETTLITDISNARQALTLCQALGTCTTEQSDLAAAQAALKAFIVSPLSPDEAAATTAAQTADTINSEYTLQSNNYQTVAASYLLLASEVQTLLQQIQTTYDEYAAVLGMTAQISYSIPWSTIFNEWQAINPGVQFQQLPIVQTNFFASVNPVDTQASAATATSLAQVPTVLGFVIPGMPSEGPRYFPTGFGPFPRLGSGTPGPDTSQASMPFSSSVGASVAYSLLGVCNLYPNGGTSAPSLAAVNSLVAHMVSNLVYQYDVSVHRGYTATYNMSAFASRLVTVKHEGGFFTSKDITTIIQDQNSSDWFTIVPNSDSSEFQYTAAEWANIKTEAKGQLIERALQLMAMQTGVLPGAPTTNPTPTPDGVGAAASYLQSGCGYWSWCGATGFVLGVLDSIFGSQTAVQNFQQNNNVWVTDTVTDQMVLLRQGELNFKAP